MDTSYIGSEWWKQPDNIYQTLPHSKTIEIEKQEGKKPAMKGSEQSEWNEWGEWQWRRVSCGDNPRVTHGLKGRQPRGTETTWTESWRRMMGGGAQVSARIQRSLSHNKIKVTWTPARQQIGFEKNETINSCACAKTLMHQKHPCCFRRAEQCRVDFCQPFHFSWGVFKERARF